MGVMVPVGMPERVGAKRDRHAISLKGATGRCQAENPGACCARLVRYCALSPSVIPTRHVPLEPKAHAE